MAKVNSKQVQDTCCFTWMPAKPPGNTNADWNEMEAKGSTKALKDMPDATQGSNHPDLSSTAGKSNVNFVSKQCSSLVFCWTLREITHSFNETV